MKPDWIPQRIWSGQTKVYCKTCESMAEFNSKARSYECECRFGATVEALSCGLKGYIEGPSIKP